MELEILNARPAIFFDILPLEWRKSILPYWEKIKENATIYGVMEEGKVIVGGIVFSKELPQMTDFENFHGRHFFSEGYLYIGFVWVDQNRRNEQLGSKWLQLLKDRDPEQRFWLTIEDVALRKFYGRNGFRMIAESPDPQNREWLCTYEP